MKVLDATFLIDYLDGVEIVPTYDNYAHNRRASEALQSPSRPKRNDRSNAIPYSLEIRMVAQENLFCL